MLIEVWCRRFHRRHWRALPLTDATRRRGYLAFRCERCHTLTIEHVRRERALRAARVVGSSRLRAENARLRAALFAELTHRYMSDDWCFPCKRDVTDPDRHDEGCPIRVALAGAAPEDAQVDG